MIAHSTSLTHVCHPRQIEERYTTPHTPPRQPLDHTPSYNQSLSRTPHYGEAAKALDRQNARHRHNIEQAVRHMDGCEGELPVKKWLQEFFPNVVLPDEIEKATVRIKYRPKNSTEASSTEETLCAQLVGGSPLA